MQPTIKKNAKDCKDVNPDAGLVEARLRSQSSGLSSNFENMSPAAVLEIARHLIAYLDKKTLAANRETAAAYNLHVDGEALTESGTIQFPPVSERVADNPCFFNEPPGTLKCPADAAPIIIVVPKGEYYRHPWLYDTANEADAVVDEIRDVPSANADVCFRDFRRVAKQPREVALMDVTDDPGFHGSSIGRMGIRRVSGKRGVGLFER